MAAVEQEFRELSPQTFAQRLISSFLTHFDSKESEDDMLLSALGDFRDCVNIPGRFTLSDGVVEINRFADKQAWEEEFRRIRERHEEGNTVRFSDNTLYGPQYGNMRSSRTISMYLQNGRMFLRFTKAERG